MYLIHGTWIPDETSDFVQLGSFCLWVETDVPIDPPSSGPAIHPRHLRAPELEVFLGEKLGIRDSYETTVKCRMCSRFFQMPSSSDRPLPSFELLHYVAEDAPEEFDLASWQIDCYRVPNLIATLNDIHFIAVNAPDQFQLGADLVFWHQLTRTIRQVIARDQYIPALKYRDLPPANDKRKAARTAKTFELHPGWEIVSDAYETAVRGYAASMPRVCVAGSTVPDGRDVYDEESLIRHFSECLVRSVVVETPFTAKVDGQIAGTLLYDCVYPQRPSSRALSAEATLDEYRHWATWREKIIHAQTTAAFTLCFRLDEAPASAPDDWTLEFLAASKRDPSFMVSLADYWNLDRSARADLERYFGAHFERGLLLALGHAARIYPDLWQGLETAEPAGFRLSLDDAYAFLRESAWILGDAGYTVIVPAWWTPAGRRRAKIRLKTAARTTKVGASSKNGYFSLDKLVAYQYDLMIGGEVVTEDEWHQLMASKTSLVQFRGQWIEIDRDKMGQLLDFWKARQHAEVELTLPDLLKAAIETEEDLEWDHDAAIGAMLSRLQDKSAFVPVEDPPNLHATLRDYQKRGVAWLHYLESLGLNPCLADDMGLGKTLEVIAHLVGEKNGATDLPPTLVIAPTSVVGNWRKEIERFAPSLRTLVHHGSGRVKQEGAFRAAARDCDVVLTSFALARLDEKLLRAVEWRRIVVDEAQNIKNPEAAQTRAVAKLHAERRLALTGTPVENRLLDLWSIFNFLNPGYLGKQAQFRKSFELPIQKNDDRTRSATLKKLVEPFILRRLKTDGRIISDLPEKVEQKMYCNLTPEQASLYAAVVKDVEEKLESAEGIGRRGLILATLTRLKQICNHPAQFLQDGSAFTGERSHKLKRLAEMVEEAIESGESLLVFTQYAEIGGALEDYLARTLRCTVYYLHGGTSTTRREQMVTAFQNPDAGPAAFILSLRAGGVGLNLTRANHVFHFDRWWNPAVEDQATDRAFRIGQRKNVFVHKFVAIGTLEERIDQMIEDKKRISATIVGGDESWLTELDNESFKELIALRRGAVLE